jgi:hypothetical protein
VLCAVECSTGNSGQPANCSLGVHVKQTREGKWGALAWRFAAASRASILLSADGITDPVEMPRCVGTLFCGGYVAKGSRLIPRKIRCAECNYEASEQASERRSSAI